jgi:hypothetical protein
VVVTLELTDTGDGDPASESRILLAVSKTSAPASATSSDWYYHAIDSKTNIGGTDTWADYPGFEADEEAIYITTNMFSFIADGRTNEGVRLWIVDKGAGSGGFYDGGAAAVTIHDPYAGGGFAVTTMPAQVYGAGGVGGNVGTFLVSHSGLSSGGNEVVQVVRVDDPLGTPTFTQEYVNVGDIDDVAAALPDAPQSDTTTLIEVNDRRALDAVWRDNALWLTTTILPNSGPDIGQTTAHWFKLDTSSVPGGAINLADQGNIGGEDISAQGTYTFFPSVAVNSQGDAKFGFAASASDIFPGAYVTGREAGDAAGTVQGSGAVRAGDDYYIRTFGGSRNRWGDYSGISLDPTDDSVFWVFNQYAAQRGTPSTSPPEDGRWGTAWASCSFEQPTDTTPPETTANPPGGTYGSTQNVTLNCTDDDSGCNETFYGFSADSPVVACTADTLYTGPISINVSGELCFYSTDNAGNTESPENVETYIIQAPVDTTPPVTTANPPGGTYGSAQNVTLNCTDDDSGCNETFYGLVAVNSSCTASTPYTGAIAINASADLCFYSTDVAGNTESPQNLETYTIQVQADTTPPTTTANPSGGIYDSAQSVTLNCTDDDSGCSETKYGLAAEGSACTADTTYSGTPILITSNIDLCFYSTDNAGNTESPQNLETYTIIKVEHFLSYKIRRAHFDPVGPITIRDQFGARDYYVRIPFRLYNPVSKNLGGIDDTDTHLMGYRLGPVRLSCTEGSPQNEFFACETEEDCGGITGQTQYCRRPVTREIHKNLLIENQFGKIFVDTLLAEILLVPSSKDLITFPPTLDPLDIDHFKCYRVRAARRGICQNNLSLRCKTDQDCDTSGPCIQSFSRKTVYLEDQFAKPQVFNVVRASRLCAPAQKNDEPMVGPNGINGTHLMCYKVRRALRFCNNVPFSEPVSCKKERNCGGQLRVTNYCEVQKIRHEPTEVFINNQFGSDQQFLTLIEDELCVPSTKTVLDR